MFHAVNGPDRTQAVLISRSLPAIVGQRYGDSLVTRRLADTSQVLPLPRTEAESRPIQGREPGRSGARDRRCLA